MLVGLAAAHASTARAGDWIQVSCVNPNGSASNSQGWSGAASGPYATGDISSTSTCGPGTPLVAEQEVIYGTPPSYGSAETITYTPPAGSSLAGGSAAVSLEAYAYGTSSAPAYSDALVASPNISNVIQVVTCGAPGCGPDTFTGTVSLPPGAGGVLFAEAGCGDLVQSTDECSEGYENGVYARARVSSADLLLSTAAQPQASGFQGTALQHNASGTAGLVFSASDPVGAGTSPPSGPGIYSVAVSIDGHTVYSGTPNTDGGSCVAVGGGNGTPLMFDSQQPCPPAETVDVPVPTRGLPDGRHRLIVTVADAAGDAAPVLDRYISTFNPQLTPLPRHRGTVRARFLLSWRWSGRSTTLRSASVRHLPRNATVTIACRGHGCRHVPGRAGGRRAVARLLRGLGGHRFRSGDRIRITVTAPRRRAERILLRIRNGHIPSARLG